MKNKSPRTENRLLQRRSDLLFSQIDDETVMFSIETSEYYGLNSIASRIWELLETPQSLSRLVEMLTEEFEIDTATCGREVAVFLEQLLKKKLIITVEEVANN